MPRRTVLITGASRGIGLATARLLRSRGDRVIGLARHPPELPFPGEFHAVDLADGAAAGRFLTTLTADTGIDALVNNVGSAEMQRLGQITTDGLQRLFDLNIKSTVAVTQACVDGMRARRWGRIVSVSSRAILGKEGRSAYSATKAGLIGLTRTWALELARDGITVNAVAPGPIATEMFDAHNPPTSPETQALIEQIPVGRIGRAEEVAAAIAFFLSEEAGYITGQTLYVCGGLSVGRAWL
jgi:NAD(P)-dependent dehydrogenase (short-subunit alcohol dehydrogenase family)